MEDFIHARMGPSCHIVTTLKLSFSSNLIEDLYRASLCEHMADLQKYDYTALLKRAESELPTEVIIKERFEIPKAVVFNEGKTTILKNLAEIANKVKKLIRDGASAEELAEKKIQIGYEIGDVLWYAAVLADEMGMNLGHIMENNLQKLADRKARGKLTGSGDNR